MGHHEGAFEVDDSAAPCSATYRAAGCSAAFNSKSIAGMLIAPIAVFILSYSDGGFEDQGRVDGISESLRFLAIDNNTIWASHPYRGVFKINYHPAIQVLLPHTCIQTKRAFQSSLNNFVSVIKTKLSYPPRKVFMSITQH